MPRFDAVGPDQVADAQAEQAAELFEPSPGEHVVLGRGGGAAIFVLRVLAPDDQRHVELHGSAHRDREDADVLGPRDVADVA